MPNIRMADKNDAAAIAAIYRPYVTDAVTSEANKCLAAVQSDPSYKACSCPNYPAGNVGCYHFCAAAYQRGNSCSASNLVRDCRADGDRCRAQCQ